MSQYVRNARLTLSSGLVVAIAMGCGHSKQFEDAYEKTKSEGSTPSKGGTSGTAGTGGTAGMGGSTSGTAGMSGTAPLGCTDAPTQQFDSVSMDAYTDAESAAVRTDVDSYLNIMSQEQQISQMLGVPVGNYDYQDIERSPDVELQGGTKIRGYNYRDAGRGVNLDAGQSKSTGTGARVSDGNDFATVFPCSSVRAASWDVELERRVGSAMGDEVAASHNNMLLAPCMNIIRHPFWGRTQETYSEDTYHTGRMATAYTVGLQEYVTGCAKHFAANNIEKQRSQQDAVIEDEQTLREIYGRHFEMVIRDGGIGCIMASYNMINGVKSTQNHHLLTDILRGPVDKGGFGYKGLVISDWWAMPGDQLEPDAAGAYSLAVEAVKAGLDVEVPWTFHYSTTTLTQAVADNAITGLDISAAAGRVMEQKFRFKTALETDGWSIKPPMAALSASGGSIDTNLLHEDLAEEAETKSAVLLSNGKDTPVLPIKAATKIAVVGLDQPFSLISTTPPKSGSTFHFATDPALGDRGSSRVNGDPMRTIGPTDGIRQSAPMGVTVTNYGSLVDPTTNPPAMAAAAAAAAVGAADPDFVVVVVGYTPEDEGEEYAIQAGGDRHTLDLPDGHNALVSAVLALNKPTAIIIESGSITNLPWLADQNANQATVWAGYGGTHSGLALGKLLFGTKNFTGKMPLAWPASDAEIKQPFKEDLGVGRTSMGYFFGYREYDRRKAAGETVNLLFPFGHGLSYSAYTYGTPMVPCAGAATKNAIVNVTVDVTNTSADWDGEEIAMLFVKPPATPSTPVTGHRAVKELKSFARVPVGKGQTVSVTLPLRIQDLRHWEGGADGKWVIDSGDYTIMVAGSGDDTELAKHVATLTVQGD